MAKILFLGKKKMIELVSYLYTNTKNRKILALKFHWISLNIQVICTLCSLSFEILLT